MIQRINPDNRVIFLVTFVTAMVSSLRLLALPEPEIYLIGLDTMTFGSEICPSGNISSQGLAAAA